jgi:hypothetical protein
MFSWFRKTPRPPKPAPENPGRGHIVRVALKNAEKAWEETDDLIASLSAALTALGHNVTVKGDWIDLDSGFSLLPQVINIEPFESAGVKTASTIQVSHASLVPGGVFEYQYSSGTDVRDSFAQGFKNWAELDLPVFLDALRDEAVSCMVAGATAGGPTSVLPPNRRLLFGPTIQMAQKPEALPGQDDFCPCCLFTRSIDAFNGLMKADAFYGVRLFATRDNEGLIQADCRVNGIDMPQGAEALTRYAQTWPDRGYEYRKQYVGIQTRAGKVVSGGRQVGQHVTVPGGGTP